MSYKVKISAFEGPFDLLVYLIENSQMNILDIQVADITGQYMEYMSDLSSLDVEKASEFMVLAANLLEIKSRTMLPQDEKLRDGIVEEDPRSRLVERILEYKRFKILADKLDIAFDDNSHIYSKPQEDISRYTENPDEYLSLNIEEFAKAFMDFINRKQKMDSIQRNYTRIQRERGTMESKIEYIGKRFQSAIAQGIKEISMDQLVCDRKDKFEVVLTFVSTLQMVNRKMIEARQNRLYGDILLKLASGDKNEQQ